MIAPADLLNSYRPPSNAADRANRALLSREASLHDATLARRFGEGDESAFVEIMDRHRKRLFAVAYSVLRDRGDAEEIAQDAFVRAHAGFHRFRGESSVATWLHRIALNLARNRYWYFFRRRRYTSASLDKPIGEDGHATMADSVASESVGPDHAMVNGEFAALILECVKQLPVSSQEILGMRATLHQSYEEISATLGIRIGTVKSRIGRARMRLRSLLAVACPELALDTPLGAFLN